MMMKTYIGAIFIAMSVLDKCPLLKVHLNI
jgi:hypothetical protein